MELDYELSKSLDGEAAWLGGDAVVRSPASVVAGAARRREEGLRGSDIAPPKWCS